ncbi:MAG: universal stress protein, partial [Chloroflexota bacterium]
SGAPSWESGGVTNKLASKITRPLRVVSTNAATNGKGPGVGSIVVALDGSIRSEASLPFARTLAKAFDSKLILLAVPAVPEAKEYGAVRDVVEQIRTKAIHRMGEFLEAVASSLRESGVKVRTIVTGSKPGKTIGKVAIAEDVNFIMMTSRGRGTLDQYFMGSVAEDVIRDTKTSVFLIPIHDNNN